MTTYAIGDIQGCLRELHELLDLIGFTDSDQLWFTGDLVNRGPESLQTLRFIRSLGNRATTVLGNHDIHLLAAAQDSGRTRRKDTLDEIIAAPDRDELLDWLRQHPLFYQDQSLGFCLVHAGVAPQWDLLQINQLAREVSDELKGENYQQYLAHIYGDQPAVWSDDLSGMERLRCITNYFTRIRFCDQNGVMDFREKGPPGHQPADWKPWYAIENRKSADLKIIFGHWSTHKLARLDVRSHNVYPIDSGCLWGGELTALRLEDEELFQIQCKHRRYPD